MSGWNPAYGGAWKHARLAILARDRYTCQIRRAGCTGRATQVDHIVPLAHGGPRLDPTNLRAACRHCNIAEGNTTMPRKLPHHLPPSRPW